MLPVRMKTDDDDFIMKMVIVRVVDRKDEIKEKECNSKFKMGENIYLSN